jgi:serine/threonine protein kinase
LANQLLIAPAAGLLMPGMKLGKYQLVRKLAVGGMAEIYLAKAIGIEGFEKLLVLKRILPAYAAKEELLGMFLQEARLAATLHHPNIAQTYDIGSEGGSYFYAMEYVHGEDMRQILRVGNRLGKPLPLPQALNVVLGVCAGLHHAHELGIVHRDVSPSNVLVSYDGRVKVVDFGVAKTAAQGETRVGTLKGKIAYMSPEQCRGERLDRRADIFAIGILLYEFTTHTRLFHGDNEFAILSRIVHEDAPRPQAVRPAYPRDLERIVLKALRRSRHERYASAQELAADLAAFARSQRLGTTPESLADYMEDLFGKQADPWVELAGRREVTVETGFSHPRPFPLPPPPPARAARGTAEHVVADVEPSAAIVPRRRRSGKGLLLLATLLVLAGGAAVLWTMDDDGPGATSPGAMPPAAMVPPAQAPATATPAPAGPETATPVPAESGDVPAPREPARLVPMPVPAPPLPAAAPSADPAPVESKPHPVPSPGTRSAHGGKPARPAPAGKPPAH